MESNERDFKGIWISKEIWLDRNLSCIEKCLIAEIDSLDNDEEKGCFASNKYLGEFIGVTEGRTANIISDLKKRGYIFQCFFDGRNRGLRVNENVKAQNKRESRLHENVKADFTKTLKQTSRKREYINTIDNKEYKKDYSSSSFDSNSQTQIPPFVADEQNEFRKKVEEYKTEVATPTYNREQTFEILKNDKLCRETFEKEIFRLNQNRAYARQKKIETLVPENAKRLFEEYVDECCLNAEKDEKFPRKISESKRHLTSFMKIKFQRDQENIINRLNRPY